MDVAPGEAPAAESPSWSRPQLIDCYRQPERVDREGTAVAGEGGRRRQRAFIGSFTAAGGPGVVTVAVAGSSGALTVLSSVDGVLDPSYLALSSDGGTLYAVSETAEGAVAAYRVKQATVELTGP